MPMVRPGASAAIALAAAVAHVRCWSAGLLLVWGLLSWASAPCAAAPLARGWVFDNSGAITEDPGEVISGRKSIKGFQTGTAAYRSYFRSDPGAFPLAAGRAYRVTFRYKILTTPDRGFEVLLLSPSAFSSAAPREPQPFLT